MKQAAGISLENNLGALPTTSSMSYVNLDERLREVVAFYVKLAKRANAGAIAKKFTQLMKPIRIRQ